jgi:hypothetical protein
LNIERNGTDSNNNQLFRRYIITSSR